MLRRQDHCDLERLASLTLRVGIGNAASRKWATVDQKVTINRSLVGWLALAFLTAFAISLVTGPEETADPWQGIFSRVGVVLATLWLALPKDGSLGKWSEVSLLKLAVILLAIVAFIQAPRKYLPILLAIAAAGRFLRPPGKLRPPRDFA